MEVLGTSDSIHLVLWFYRWLISKMVQLWEGMLGMSWGPDHEQVPWLPAAQDMAVLCAAILWNDSSSLLPLCGSKWRMKSDGHTFYLSLDRQSNSGINKGVTGSQKQTGWHRTGGKVLLWIESRLKDWKQRIKLGRQELSSRVYWGPIFIHHHYWLGEEAE